MDDPTTTTQTLEEPNIHVSLTHQPLDIPSTIDRIRSPSAGAIVLFAGTTRATFNNHPVLHLHYTSYIPKALQTLQTIARTIHTKHALTAISITHRLGTVPIGEESILIALSAPHRGPAWRAGEEALEECKGKVEVWKLEEFGGEVGGVWRANGDGEGGEVGDGAVGTGVGGEGRAVDGVEGRLRRPGAPRMG